MQTNFVYNFCILLVLSLAYFVASNSNTMTWRECRVKAHKDSRKECCILKHGHVQLIERDTQMCCNGEVFRHSPNGRCCYNPTNDDSVFYNKNEKKCCAGNLHDIADGNAHQCCGEELYNNKTQLCCQIDHEMRISYRVYEKKKYPICPIYYCNKEPYEKTQKNCCNDKLIPVKANHDCCGNSLYNKKTQVCCDGRKHQKHGESEKCCGKMYLREDEDCCGVAIIKPPEKCCGEKTYNSSQHKCTADSKIVTLETLLCDNREYNTDTQLCCGSFAMTKRNQGDNECCKPRGHKPGTTFNNKTMVCDGGKLRSTVRCGKQHTPDKYTCCNNYAYNQPAENSVCCDGRAEWYKRDSNEEGCRPPLCNGEWYDDRDQDCCNNTLINRQRLRCINQKAYHYYDKNDNLFSNLRICGRYAISRTYKCCAGVMPYKYSTYTCPLSNFGSEKPIKPLKYPFWPLIKCRSKKLSATVTDTVQNGAIITVFLRAKHSRKLFRLNISTKQELKIKALKSHKASVNVYFEESIGNHIFLGDHGAIERSRRRRKARVDKKICREINTFLEMGSS